MKNLLLILIIIIPVALYLLGNKYTNFSEYDVFFTVFFLQISFIPLIAYIEENIE